MKPWNKISPFLKPLFCRGIPPETITHLTGDSRAVNQGAVFFAWQGRKADGHQYIPEAVAKGAKVIIHEKPLPTYEENCYYVQVSSARAAYAHLCAAYWDFPAQKLYLLGVTGTNGKSSTAYYLYQMWQPFTRAGLIGTVFTKIAQETHPSLYTTPDAGMLQALLAQMVQAGVTHVVMEVSSHALDQDRVAGIDFQGALFTNLTQDHLDYHGSMEAYRDAKKKLFDGLSRDAFAVTNADDPNGAFMVQNVLGARFRYGIKKAADLRARILESTPHGMLIMLRYEGRESPPLTLPLLTQLNVYNALGAALAAHHSGLSWEELFPRLTLLNPLPGRLEWIPLHQQKIAVIDYAHTPDAVEKVLRSLRQLHRGPLIAVLGCGGDRDPSKRPLMGKIAVRYADQVFFTSDNPRSEDPWAIIQAMYADLSLQEKTRVSPIVDRAEAIAAALETAPPKSLIAIVGKGHETYQEIQGKRIPFSDRQHVEAYAQRVASVD
ncbi:MAG: UDP-N-acetylmuramoyl-L-alanyl-D-glutamate--2,6-diaminopimelate ligase [Bacteroidia bacterium]